MEAWRESVRAAERLPAEDPAEVRRQAAAWALALAREAQVHGEARERERAALAAAKGIFDCADARVNAVRVGQPPECTCGSHR
jgi:hypothetical protein